MRLVVFSYQVVGLAQPLFLGAGEGDYLDAPVRLLHAGGLDVARIGTVANTSLEKTNKLATIRERERGSLFLPLSKVSPPYLENKTKVLRQFFQCETPTQGNNVE